MLIRRVVILVLGRKVIVRPELAVVEFLFYHFIFFEPLKRSKESQNVPEIFSTLFGYNIGPLSTKA